MDRNSLKKRTMMVIFLIISFAQFTCCSSEGSLLDEVEAEMSCPSSQNCHSKLILYATGIAIGGITIGYFIGQKVAKSRARCNYVIKLNTDKVVDTADIEDLGDKKVFCRCWKSKKFPLCDGSHGAHNKETGDNVGPLIIKKKET